MKSARLFLLLVIVNTTCQAQQTIKLKTLWTKPEVELIFGEFKIFFRIKDIDKAMKFLSPIEQGIYGTSSGLDTNKAYVVELESGRAMEYQNALEPLLQNGVGAYLLFSGHANVIRKRHKKIHNIEVEVGQATDYSGFFRVPVTVYDPKTKKMIFSGAMDDDMYRKDIGFD